jgi:hypothetical protein
MNTNPYTITTTMGHGTGGGGGQLNRPAQLAEDEQLNLEEKAKWEAKSDDEKTIFLQHTGVTWGHNVPDTHRSSYARDRGVAVASHYHDENMGIYEESRILGQIHIGVFGACRILLHANYISRILLENICKSVNKEALDAPASSVIWETGTLHLRDSLRDAVDLLNAAWTSGDIETQESFVKDSLTPTLTDDDKGYPEDQVQTLSKLITARGQFTNGQWNQADGFNVRESSVMQDSARSRTIAYSTAAGRGDTPPGSGDRDPDGRYY